MNRQASNSRRLIAVVVTILIGLALGFFIKKVPLGLLIGLVMGLLVSGLVSKK